MGNTLTEGLRALVSIYDWKVRADADLFMAAADIIDEQHERECKEQYACGAEHGIGASIEASMIQDHGYIELPKDADGKYVHIGDTVEWVDGPHQPITVVGVGKNTLFYIDDDANAQWTMAITKRHHTKTVEDVLREFTDAILEWSAKSGTVADVGTWSDVAVEYAAKLRLAESEES